MRQVSEDKTGTGLPRYCIVGRGRLACHLIHFIISSHCFQIHLSPLPAKTNLIIMPYV